MAHYHYGNISTMNFRGYSMHNYGYLSTCSYENDFMTNYGTVIIANSGLVNLGAFELKKGGKLILNNLQIAFGEELEPELRAYLTRHGGTITETPDTLTLRGKFKVNIAELKKILPQKFGKYDDTGSSYEWKSGAWLPNSYPSSKSVSKTGEEKYWRKTALDAKYKPDAATIDIFCGKLAKKLTKAASVTKVTLDVFSKAVMTQVLSKTSAVPTPQDAAAISLQQNIGRVLATATPQELNAKLYELVPKAQPGASVWSRLFAAAPILSAEQVLATISSTVDSLVADDGNMAEEIVAEVTADFAKINNKFTSDEIDNCMLPTLNQCATSLKTNAKLAQDVLAILKQPEAKQSTANTAYTTPIMK